MEDMKPGSFNWYLTMGGGFVKALAKTIQVADSQNQSRLELGFPQMVAAWRCHSWDEVPEGFEPVYNADKPQPANIIPFPETPKGKGVA